MTRPVLPPLPLPPSLKLQRDPQINLPHPIDGRWPSKERRRHGAAVARVISLVGQVLCLNEELHAVAFGPLIEGAHLRGSAATEDADTGRQRRDSAERELIRGEEEHVGLSAGAQVVASDTSGTIVEHAVVVAVASREERGRRSGAGVA